MMNKIKGHEVDACTASAECTEAAECTASAGKDPRVERLAEEVMETFGKELGAACDSYYASFLEPGTEIMDFETWKQKQGNTSENKADGGVVVRAFEASAAAQSGGSKGKLRRVLILAAVLALVMGLAMIAAEGVKLKKSTMRMQDTPGESTKLIDMDKAKYDVEDFRVTYVPEGYELVEDVVVCDEMREICYYNEYGKGLQVHIIKTDQFSANVDNEETGREEVLVNDKQAYVLYDGETGFIVWQMGDCTIDITADINQEELISTASQIYVN